MHIRSRSYQIYRALCPTLTRDALTELLESLLRSVTEVKRLEFKTIAIEILFTLQVRHRPLVDNTTQYVTIKHNQIHYYSLDLT